MARIWPWLFTRVEIVTMRPTPAASARATMVSSSAAKSGKSRWQWLSTSMRKSPATVGEDQRHIIGGHLDRLVQAEPGGFTHAFKLGNITQAPRRVARLQRRIESGVRRRVMHAITHERTV